MNVAAESVRQQIELVLTAWGMEADMVGTTADAMLYSDLAGIESHGISMLMAYEDYRAKGKLNLRSRPRIVRENPVTALVDAGAGLGHAAAVMAMELANKKASAMGIGAVSVFNSHHFGPTGYYAALASKQGLVGFVTSSTHAVNVVPTRSSIPVLGTNPIAFAAPARRNRPFLLDIATSTVAGNKVRIYDLNQKPLPPGWVLDEAGKSVCDAALAMDYIRNRDVGGITPLGGTAEMGNHKGYGLSMMAQILGATLAGASFSPVRFRTQPESAPNNIGHFFMAIDPKAFRSEGEFEDDMDQLIDEMHDAAPADPAQPVLVAGDPEALQRETRLRLGIPLSVALAGQLQAVCQRSGVPFVLK